MNKSKTINIVLSAMFLSIGIVLPLLTGQIKEIGDSLLPMHLPVMLCGLICGAPYGAVIGLLLPFLRSLIFGMPPIYPNAVWMAAELATYGLIIGVIYSAFKCKGIKSIYASLVAAMLSASDDGTGGDHFYHQLADNENIDDTIELFLKRGRNETAPDQWQSQILLRILKKATVIYVSNLPDDMVKSMHMLPSHNLADAITLAKQILNNNSATITAIPDGLAVMVVE